MTFYLNEALDKALKAERSYRTNSDPDQFVPELIADETNKANGTYDYYVDMSSFTQLMLDLILTGTITVKIYGSGQDDGTAPGSISNWTDITNSLYGAASFTATGMLLDTTRVAGQCKYVKVEVVCAGGGTDDYTIYSKKLY